MKRIHLRTARAKKRWTQEQLEAETARRGRRVPQSIISKLETTHSNAWAETALSLADALEVDPRALKFGPDPVAR